MIPRSSRLAAIVVVAALAFGASAAPAAAFNPVKPLCGAAGLLSGLAGKACSVVQNSDRLLSAGKNLANGRVGSAVKSFAGGGGGGSSVSTAIGLAAIGAWVLGGAKFALHETATILSKTTTPQLRSTWFSGVYWRMAGIAALLTLPFLFAAAVQALMRSDLALLLRATFGYLPLALLAVSVAAPLTMLLLAASDQLSAAVSSAAGHASTRFLNIAGGIAGALTVLSRSPFVAFFLGLLMVAGAVALWFELLLREAAVYVIVLMLPLAFAALVWPARRIWAISALELLVALILSKFAIVAVLSLGGAALGTIGHSVTGVVAGFVLVMMGVFAPWALLRLLPLAELASGAAASLRGDLQAVPGRLVPLRGRAEQADGVAASADEWATATTARMRREREAVAPSDLSSRGPVPDDGQDRHARPPDVPAEAELVPEAPSEASSANASTASASNASSGRRQRSPGMEPMWQASDGSWRPLTLGLEDGWPPPPLWSPEEEQPAGATRAAPERAGAAPEPTRAAPADDHDPKPPPQAPEGGRL